MELYPFESFLAEFGGALGLFTGFSFMFFAGEHKDTDKDGDTPYFLCRPGRLGCQDPAERKYHSKVKDKIKIIKCVHGLATFDNILYGKFLDHPGSPWIVI